MGSLTKAASQQLVDIDYDFDPLDLHAAHPERYPFFLESTARGSRQARFDFLFASPGERLSLAANGSLNGPGVADGGFLRSLDAWWAREGGGPEASPDIPFAGGWFLLLAYELAAEVEPSVRLVGETRQPLAVAVRIPIALVRDHQEQRAYIVGEPGHEDSMGRVEDDLRRLSPLVAAKRGCIRKDLMEESPVKFREAVRKAKEHIVAGDIFQANLSRVWCADLKPDVSAVEVYARLRRTNPGPFAGLAVLDDFAVISSSPERLVQWGRGRISTRPIAGTRPRRQEDTDEFTRAELLGDPKDRAEHVMLIDLERNDLGRICAAGSVQVDEFMVLESYSQVHHIVSNVSGELRTGVTPAQVIRATFPGGTITGCPKVRCMEIIAALEARPRGFYTGAMGYLNRDGSGDLNILIRSMVMQDQAVSLAAGSGIVADSQPALELEETRAKARGMLLALE